MDKYYYIKDKTTATTNSAINNNTIKNLWKNFSFTELELKENNGEFTFIIGNTTAKEIVDSDTEYLISVDNNGAAVTGKNYCALVRGIIVLLLKLEVISCQEGFEEYRIPYMQEKSHYKIKNRMIHICVFPENDLLFIKRLIRLVGLCQYTHIIIEFWGMLKYDCLKELSWPHAFTKEQAKELIKECREFGMEPIPMFNQLGHASASRECFGKHVVLDQNPRLQHLFTPDGWAWDINSKPVLDLLKQVRQELYQVFGEGEYMHIGCDEAYYYTHCDEERKKLPTFLKNLTDEVAKEGRRPMVWMDMMLERDKYNKKFCAYASCPPNEVEKMQEALNPSTVMVDWQYDMNEAPIETLVSLKNNIRDAMGAPWYEPKNYAAYIETIVQHDMFGIMLTTWHTLKDRMTSILRCAKDCGAQSFDWSEFSGFNQETATLLRKVSFENSDYTDFGWSKNQINI